MKSKKIKVRTAEKETDYILDPITRRSCFIHNNKAALIHGGYSKHISDELLKSILDNDLGFEIGLLKGQLSNLAIMGGEVINELQQQGEKSAALDIALSCADRASKLVPQIKKVLESPLVNIEQPDPKILRTRNRWLKKLHNSECPPSEVAYQFEINNLGPLPDYIIKLLQIELNNVEPEIVTELYSREELQNKLTEYWKEVDCEKSAQLKRQEAIHKEKKRVNDLFFKSGNQVDKED